MSTSWQAQVVHATAAAEALKNCTNSVTLAMVCRLSLEWIAFCDEFCSWYSTPHGSLWRFVLAEEEMLQAVAQFVLPANLRRDATRGSAWIPPPKSSIMCRWANAVVYILSCDTIVQTAERTLDRRGTWAELCDGVFARAARFSPVRVARARQQLLSNATSPQAVVGGTLSVCQPTALVHPHRLLQALCRSRALRHKDHFRISLQQFDPVIGFKYWTSLIAGRPSTAEEPFKVPERPKKQPVSNSTLASLLATLEDLALLNLTAPAVAAVMSPCVAEAHRFVTELTVTATQQFGAIFPNPKWLCGLVFVRDAGRVLVLVTRLRNAANSPMPRTLTLAWGAVEALHYACVSDMMEQIGTMPLFDRRTATNAVLTEGPVLPDDPSGGMLRATVMLFLARIWDGCVLLRLLSNTVHSDEVVLTQRLCDTVAAGGLTCLIDRLRADRQPASSNSVAWMAFVAHALNDLETAIASDKDADEGLRRSALACLRHYR